MTATPSRTQWLGYRWAQHGLGSAPTALDDLLLLGVQDDRQHGQRQALAQRTARDGRAEVRGVPVVDAAGPDGPLVIMWSVRGAPHTHDASMTALLASALAPRETDEGGAEYVAAVHAAAEAMTRVVTERTTKAEVSSRVAQAVPALARTCPRCEADHLPDAVFRAAGLQARLVLGPPEGRSTTLCPPPQTPQAPTRGATRRLLTAMFALNGPQSRASIAAWLGATPATAAGWWAQIADEVEGVDVDGRRLAAPPEVIAAVAESDPPRGVSLLPPGDPYLRQTDRTLLVPDKNHRSRLFTALSGPGAVVVDGEVAGTWRHRVKDGVTIELFGPLRRGAEREAEAAVTRLALGMGTAPPPLTWN